MNINITELKVINPRNLQESKQHLQIYIWPKGETILENLNNRHDRPYNFYKKEVLPIIKENLREQGINIEGMQISWSQYAGCKCGCSPGFIVKGPGMWGKHIHVTIEMAG